MISSSPRGDGRDRLDRLPDRVGEHVDADEREVGARLARLLDEPCDPAVLVELGDPELAGVVDVLQQDQRVGRLAAELVDESRDAVGEEVVAEVHDEGLAGEEVLGDQDGVCEAARRVLWHVRHLDAERGAVADRRADLVLRVADDDPDLADAGIAHRFEREEQDRLVADRNELLRRGMRDRREPGAGPTSQNQPAQGASLNMPASILSRLRAVCRPRPRCRPGSSHRPSWPPRRRAACAVAGAGASSATGARRPPA